MEYVWICHHDYGSEGLSQPLAVFTDEAMMKLWLNGKSTSSTSIKTFKRLINTPLEDHYTTLINQED